MSLRAGVIGARGYVGGELIALIDGHPEFFLAYVASRASAGQPISALASNLKSELLVSAPKPDDAAAAALDVCFLAVPNGATGPYVDAFELASPNTILIDLSADHRFTDDWVYGLPERNRLRLAGARRIANPGCYATSVQLALGPFAGLIDGPASAFGVSGYSGAGSTPSPRNDVERLAENVMPYALAGHGHESEIRRHLGAEVNFTPHVAGYFRGIIATAHARLVEALTPEEATALMRAAYADEAMVRVQDEPPEMRDGRGVHGAVVGGVGAVPAERRIVVACALDNLLKGAASQAVQNANLALGLAETAGLTPMASPV